MRTNDGHCEGPAGADSAMRLRCGPYTQYRSHCARFWAIVIVPVFGPWQTPTAWDREFLRQNAGKLICFNCAGQVPDSYRYRVRCTVCAAEGPYCSTEAEAVSQWNACNKAQLLAACKAQLDLFESWKEGIFTRLGIQWEVEPEAVTMARAAIAAAEVKP